MKKMSKQDVETVIFENAKTGEALEFQHEQHKAEYGAKHFWKADKKFFELLSTFPRQKARWWHISCKKRSPQRMSLSEPIKPLLENWNAMLQQFATHSKR